MNSNIANYIWFGLLIGIVASQQTTKVVGGKAANIREHPYQVSIRFRGEVHCGGAIVDELHVVTAAHCIGDVLVPPFKDVFVHTGTHSARDVGYQHKIASIVGHPGYDAVSSHRNDIAVITLTEPIVFDDKQKKVNLPSRDIYSGEPAVITGWGYTSFDTLDIPVHLQMAKMNLMTSSECQTYLQPISVFDEQICAFQKKGVGSCMGDSGGPLVANGELVGITSWGIPCALGYPDIYSNVYLYKDFIKSVIDTSL